MLFCLFNTLATVLQMKDTGKGKKRVELLPELETELKTTNINSHKMVKEKHSRARYKGNKVRVGPQQVPKTPSMVVQRHRPK